MRSIVIGTAGHIDHGKSALVRALTGTDPDRLKEEQERGITIDLGFAHLESDGVNLAFVDVPGHERFVKNMLAGAAGIDLVLLVVAADEAVMPQTREHFQICRLLRIPAGVIALTKMDVADADARELAVLEVRELTEGSFLAGAPIVEVSAKTGAGLDELRTTLTAMARRVPERSAQGHTRMPIDRVFTVRGFGTVVTGTLVSGEVHENDELTVLPADRRVKARGVQIHGHTERTAAAGRRVAVNVGGAEVDDLQRGDTLCAPGAFQPTRRCDVLVELLPGARPLKHGARVRFHSGTSELVGRLALADGRGSAAGVSEAAPGSSVYARLRLESAAVVTRGDRFILRAYSPPTTIGGGEVLDPFPPRSAIRTAAGLARFRSLDPRVSDADRAAATFIEERGGAGLTIAQLIARAGLSRADAEGSVTRLTAGGRILRLDDLLVGTEVTRHLEQRLLEQLHAHHRAQPLSDGMPREEARERLFGHAAPALFDDVVRRLAAANRIVARDRLALQGHAVALSPEEARARDRLEQIFREARLAPPDLASATTTAGTTASLAERVVALLVRRGTLVRVDTLLFHAEALEQLKVDVRELGTRKPPARVDVAGFKERYGVTRKYAIPLLEYLDRERVTRRVGDSRIVL